MKTNNLIGLSEVKAAFKDTVFEQVSERDLRRFQPAVEGNEKQIARKCCQGADIESTRAIVSLGLLLPVQGPTPGKQQPQCVVPAADKGLSELPEVNAANEPDETFFQTGWILRAVSWQSPPEALRRSPDSPASLGTLEGEIVFLPVGSIEAIDTSHGVPGRAGAQ